MANSMVKATLYKTEYKQQWDEFLSKAKNRHFFFFRDYMEYHQDRFQDFSLLFFNEREHLLAVMPASVAENVVTSHGGLTFGGIISGAKMTAAIMLEVFDVLMDCLRRQQISEFIYKPLPYIYHEYPAQEDLYALFRNGAELFRRDVSSAIYLPGRYSYSKGRKWMCGKGRKNQIQVEESCAFDEFMELENIVLSKYHSTKAVHTGVEIRLLAAGFPQNIKLFAGKKDGVILAGALIFDNGAAVHVQYMANSDEGRNTGALDAVIDYLITDVYKDRKYFDFGISNEKCGWYLNEGLIAQKEGFGARAVAHDFYRIML